MAINPRPDLDLAPARLHVRAVDRLLEAEWMVHLDEGLARTVVGVAEQVGDVQDRGRGDAGVLQLYCPFATAASCSGAA